MNLEGKNKVDLERNNNIYTKIKTDKDKLKKKVQVDTKKKDEELLKSKKSKEQLY